MSKNSIVANQSQWPSLIRFIAGYALIIMVALYAVPVLAEQAEMIYESMSRAMRFSAVVLFAAAVGLWHFMSQRKYNKN